MANSVIVGQGGIGVAGGVSPAVGVNGTAAPLSSIEVGFIDVSGNEAGVSAANPLPVTGTVSATNPSVGLTGATAPTSATEIGVIDNSGKLQGASSSNPVRIDPTGTTIQPVSGTITANQGTTPWIVAGGGTAGTAATGVITVQGIASMTPLLVTATFSAPQHVIVDSGTIAVTQSTSPWVTSDNHLPAAGALADNLANPTTTEIGANLLGWDATNSVWRRVQVDAGTGTIKVDPGTVAVTQSTSPWVVSLASTTITGTVTVAQATAANLNAQVQGTAAGDAAASGNPVLVAGVDAGGNIQELPVADAGTALPAQVLQVGGNDGTNVRALLTDTSGRATVIGSKTDNNAAPGTNNIGALDAVANALAPSRTEGNQVLLSTDLNGSLRTMGGNIPEVTTSWTSATAGNTALTMTVLGYGFVIVTLNQTTTITGGVVTFETSDTTAFTNAYLVNAYLLSQGIGSVGNSYTLQAATNTSFAIPVAGWAAVRVRLSTVISGTGTVNVGIAASSAPDCQPQVLVTAVTTTRVESASAIAALADNQSSTTFFPSITGVNDPMAIAQWVYGGAFSGTANAALQSWSKARTPTVFTTVQATAAGATTVWTPGSGNKWRLLKLYVEVTQNASLAAGGVLTITFLDSAAAIPIAFDVFVPTTAVTTTVGAALDEFVDLGQFGILSAAANNTFRVNLSSALATGNVRINAMGVEE